MSNAPCHTPCNPVCTLGGFSLYGPSAVWLCCGWFVSGCVHTICRCICAVGGLSLVVCTPSAGASVLWVVCLCVVVCRHTICSCVCVVGGLYIIIMYIYHALVNALSTHMIHILNMIFYTHVKHSPTKTMYLKYFIFFKHKKINNKNALQTRIYIYTICSCVGGL